MPQTRIAGHTWRMPRHPAKAQISQNGTSTEKNGSCRPTMAPSRNGSRPGDVRKPLDRRAERAVGDRRGVGDERQARRCSGEKPSPIRIAPVIATGVPKPDAPSKNAPKREGDEEKLQTAVRR